MMETTGVFGRVGPQQKQAMVRALQARGHTVAMTGTGSTTCWRSRRPTSAWPWGRAHRSAGPSPRWCCWTRTSAACHRCLARAGAPSPTSNVSPTCSSPRPSTPLLALIVGVARVPFPFLPRHLTIVSSLTIGIPAFFLALAPNASGPGRASWSGCCALRCRRAPSPPSARSPPMRWRAGERVSQTEARTTATITLFLVALWVLAILARPTNPWRAGLVLAMAGALRSSWRCPGCVTSH